jgi:uncharacterized protein (DUF2235 family)
MAKNIVLCLDGTGNEVARGRTNVLLTYGMIDQTDVSKQRGYYAPGVGTFVFNRTGDYTPRLKLAPRLTGLARGVGLDINVMAAYSYLIRNYEHDDRIFLFGFSRGAYTARALTGLLSSVGILRPSSENILPYLLRDYLQSNTKDSARSTKARDRYRLMQEYRDFFGTSQWRDGLKGTPVQYLGIWDTVVALPARRRRWAGTSYLPNACAVRHAVSIDERRRPYREYLVSTPTKEPRLLKSRLWPDHAVEEVWFAGVHSDVGGGFRDDRRLADISLKWVIDGALQQGLILNRRALRKWCSVTRDDALGRVHQMGLFWLLTGRRQRILPPNAKLHQSVAERMASMPKYASFGGQPLSFADPDWLISP